MAKWLTLLVLVSGCGTQMAAPEPYCADSGPSQAECPAPYVAVCFEDGTPSSGTSCAGGVLSCPFGGVAECALDRDAGP